LILIGLAGSPMLDAWKDLGMRVVGEAFADRRYESDGQLRHRSQPDAVITDPADATAQVMSLLRHGVIVAIDGTRIPIEAQTVCIHGDTLHATTIAAAVRRGLEGEGFQTRLIEG
ncbi:MAG: LamB/YcsF family protein, partial [Lysobacteraceae bacterium]